MNLVIIAQKIDKSDDILGFFHSWVEELSEKVENIWVIANYVGDYDLPKNVEVLSLGKEKGYSRLRRYFNFYKYLFTALPKSNGVFAHMCPEYVLALWPLNLFFRKKIVLWYIHKSLSWKLKLAGKLVYKILTASEKSVGLKSQKIEITGHGINLEVFKPLPKIERELKSILYIGRISPIKKVDCLIVAAKKLNGDFCLSIVGSPFLKEDYPYDRKLKELGKDLAQKGKIKFLGKVKNSKTPEIYSRHDVFVNLSPIGLFDKTILEAMSCGCLVLASNKQFKGILPEEFIFKENDAEDLAKKIKHVFSLNKNEKEKIGHDFRNYVLKNHNLKELAGKIVDVFKHDKKD